MYDGIRIMNVGIFKPTLLPPKGRSSGLEIFFPCSPLPERKKYVHEKKENNFIIKN